MEYIRDAAVYTNIHNYILSHITEENLGPDYIMDIFTKRSFINDLYCTCTSWFESAYHKYKALIDAKNKIKLDITTIIKINGNDEYAYFKNNTANILCINDDMIKYIRSELISEINKYINYIMEENNND